MNYRNVYSAAQELLLEGKGEAENYLIKRGVSLRECMNVGVGYVEYSRDFVKSMRSKFDLDLLLKTKIIRRNASNDLVFPLSGRVTFPIRDIGGNVIAFGGRQLPRLSDTGKYAKYLNSTETQYYRKGETFFNLDDALGFVRKSRQVFLCEGFVDTMAIRTAGYHNVLGLCGTAFTQWHAYLLKIIGCEVLIYLDMDVPGREACAAVQARCAEYEIPSRVILMDHNDPAEAYLKMGHFRFFNELSRQIPTKDL